MNQGHPRAAQDTALIFERHSQWLGHSRQCCDGSYALQQGCYLHDSTHTLEESTQVTSDLYSLQSLVEI